MSDSKTNTIVSTDEAHRLAEPSEPVSLSEETIDLSALFVDDVSSSGSFDLKRSRVSPFEKLLQAIPIPTLLVGKTCTIILANRACKRVTGEPQKIEGQPFSVLFPNRADGQRAEELIRKVFHNRIPLVAEGMLGTDHIRMLGRIHFRSVRIQKMRMMLVIIEDITASEPLSRETSGPMI
jgi:two-component system cell cycle sensor histidine kinase/response regulator CckA